MSLSTLRHTRSGKYSRKSQEPGPLNPKEQLCLYPSEDAEKISSETLQRKILLTEGKNQHEDLAVATPPKEVVTPEFCKVEPLDVSNTKFAIPEKLVTEKELIETECCQYDMDSSDEEWIEENKESFNIEPRTFELMIEDIELRSQTCILNVEEAAKLFGEDNTTAMAVYNYWLKKRLCKGSSLMIQLPTCTNSMRDPYVAFRPRTRKVMTRKERQNKEEEFFTLLRKRQEMKTLLDMVRNIRKSDTIQCGELELLLTLFELRRKELQLIEKLGNHQKDLYVCWNEIGVAESSDEKVATVSSSKSIKQEIKVGKTQQTSASNLNAQQIFPIHVTSEAVRIQPIIPKPLSSQAAPVFKTLTRINLSSFQGTLMTSSVFKTPTMGNPSSSLATPNLFKTPFKINPSFSQTTAPMFKTPTIVTTSSSLAPNNFFKPPFKTNPSLFHSTPMVKNPTKIIPSSSQAGPTFKILTKMEPSLIHSAPMFKYPSKANTPSSQATPMIKNPIKINPSTIHSKPVVKTLMKRKLPSSSATTSTMLETPAAGVTQQIGIRTNINPSSIHSTPVVKTPMKRKLPSSSATTSTMLETPTTAVTQQLQIETRTNVKPSSIHSKPVIKALRKTNQASTSATNSTMLETPTAAVPQQQQQIGTRTNINPSSIHSKPVVKMMRKTNQASTLATTKMFETPTTEVDQEKQPVIATKKTNTPREVDEEKPLIPIEAKYTILIDDDPVAVVSEIIVGNDTLSKLNAATTAGGSHEVQPYSFNIPDDDLFDQTTNQSAFRVAEDSQMSLVSFDFVKQAEIIKLEHTYAAKDDEQPDVTYQE